MRALSRSRTPVERACAILDMQHVVVLAKYCNLALRHPGASMADLDAYWLEEMYGDSVPPELIERATERIRSRRTPRRVRG